MINTATNAITSIPAALSYYGTWGDFIANVPTTCGGTTPVTITDFQVVHKNETGLLSWSTKTEINTHYFIIQHSTDGTSFKEIGSVKAIGIGANNYAFSDNNPVNGINYYRLKMLDKDGSISYSKVVSIELSIINFQFSITPNPAKDKVTILGSHIMAVEVIDNIGKVVKVQALKDANNPSINVSELARGYYYLRIKTTDGKERGVGFVKE